MKKDSFVFIVFGIYISALFWLTLFSREPSKGVLGIAFFNSYRNLLAGDLSSLKEILANIILFTPAGYFIKATLKKNCVITVLIGFGLSLVIETIQLITNLGQFDVGDLFNNTLGTLLGYLIYKKISININIQF